MQVTFEQLPRPLASYKTNWTTLNGCFFQEAKSPNLMPTNSLLLRRLPNFCISQFQPFMGWFSELKSLFANAGSVCISQNMKLQTG